MSRQNKKKSLGVRSRGNRWRSILLIILPLVALALLGSGIFYYQSSVAPFRKVVLTVDNQSVRMDYFIKRTRMADNDPTLTLQQLAYEDVVKVAAPKSGITVTPSEIDAELKSQSAGVSGNQITEAAYKEWYAAKLSSTGLSDSEYRDIVRASLLATKIRDYLSKDVPVVAEQVHLYTIVVATKAEAQSARARIIAGENFSTLAGQLSQDSRTSSKGGEIGWIPRGVIPYDDVVFQLAAGQVSDPIALDSNSPDTSQYTLFLVTQKDPDRPLDNGSLQVLKSRAFYDWMLQQIPQHVKYSYTTEDQSWVMEQLAGGRQSTVTPSAG